MDVLILEDAYKPGTPSPLSPLHYLLFISVYVTYSPAHCFRQYWQLLFTFISPNCSKPWYQDWRKWVEAQRTLEEESSKMFSLFLRIITWTVGVLLAQALMENILAGVFFQPPQIILGPIHSDSTYFQWGSVSHSVERIYFWGNNQQRQTKFKSLKDILSCILDTFWVQDFQAFPPRGWFDLIIWSVILQCEGYADMILTIPIGLDSPNLKSELSNISGMKSCCM